MMQLNIKLNTIVEIAVRLVLWYLFIWLNDVDPFIRHIHPDEVWLYQYPVTPSYVSAMNLWLIIGGVPAAFLVCEFLYQRNNTNNNNDDILNAIKSLSFSYGLNGALTTILKNIIGRPRPDFFYRCFPDGKGTDFSQCAGPMDKVMNGRKSFPSGHSSFAFACMTFMSLYIARKVHFSDYSRGGQSWKMCLCILPVLAASLIAISRTCDYHHHYQDVIAGSLLGALISYQTYQLYFPKKITSPIDKNLTELQG